MHHPVPVRESQCGGDPGADRGDLDGRQALRVAQDGGEGPAFDVLHDDEIGAVVLAPVEDGDDVGMGEVGGSLGLPPKALHERAIDRELGEQDLEGDGPVELAVHGPIDLRHATTGNQVGYFVPP